MLAGALALALLVPALGGASHTPAPAEPAASADSVVWTIDATHSELTFRIRHLVSRVRGGFDRWNGTIVAEPDRLGSGSVQVAIETASIDTGNERRDDHLRSDDFFSAEAHPRITFRSRKVEQQGERIRIRGDLTMRGVTRPVVLEGTYLGITKDAQGKRRMGFEAETTINRHDFGVSWNRAVESGAMLGDDVEISIVVAAVEGS